MLVINSDGEIAVASKGAGIMLGLENRELVGVALEELFERDTLRGRWPLQHQHVASAPGASFPR